MGQIWETALGKRESQRDAKSSGAERSPTRAHRRLSVELLGFYENRSMFFQLHDECPQSETALRTADSTPRRFSRMLWAKLRLMAGKSGPISTARFGPLAADPAIAA